MRRRRRRFFGPRTIFPALAASLMTGCLSSPEPPSGSSQSVASKAAEAFERACLSENANDLQDGSSPAQGTEAAIVALSIGDKSSGDFLVRSTYETKVAENTGIYTCSVSSKNLLLDGVLAELPRVSASAARGLSLASETKAQFTGPSDPRTANYTISGRARQFVSGSTKIEVEAAVIDAGTSEFGLFNVTIEHRLGSK